MGFGDWKLTRIDGRSALRTRSTLGHSGSYCQPDFSCKHRLSKFNRLNSDLTDEAPREAGWHWVIQLPDDTDRLTTDVLNVLAWSEEVMWCR